MSFLEKAYSRSDFLDFLKNDFFSDFATDIRPVRTHEKSLLKNVHKLGDSSSTTISIFEAVCDDSDHGKRVAITQDAFRVLRDTATRNALVVFYSENSDNWRLSLLTSTFDLDDKGKVISKVSNPRRFSYYLGEGAKTVTPYNFLIKQGKAIDLPDVSSRFAVEVVNNKFYQEIAKLYDGLVGTDKITGVLKYPGDEESRHEFAVRLIGRIIFCWFLREKHSKNGVPLMPTEILSRQEANKSNYYHNVLAPLFFEVLNKQLDKREDKFSNGKYKSIPYLNGGLFNPGTDDYYKFDRTLQLSTPGLVDVPDEWLQTFFDILELYNFTVDENTSYDIDLSIDPEMLGRIFENLLARINPETGESARKSTGSYYTPREVVDYMVDRSLANFLFSKTRISLDKINALISYDLDDDKQYPLSDSDNQAVVAAIGDLTILDPACGSGAFPIGILQKVVFILQKVDADASYWLKNQLVGLSPELKRHIKQHYSVENYDYLRKLGIIRQSIFGTDIQPIAIEIAKLRCFLTLIVEEVVDDTEPNRGIDPLPNLDFKFITADSLMGLPDEINDQADIFDDKTDIDELRGIREEFFSASSSERDSVKLRFIEAQKKMLQKMIASSGFGNMTQALTAWNPFSHEKTNWFDTEWMFGIKDGFDIIIANPPYVGYNAASKQGQPVMQAIRDKKISMGNYFGVNLHSIPENPKKYAPKPNLFAFFIARGISLLKPEGQFCYIIPQTLLISEDMDVLRQHLTSTGDLNEIAVFNKRVFADRGSGSQSVATSSLLLFYRNASPKSENVLVRLVTNVSRIIGDSSTKLVKRNQLIENVSNWLFILWSDDDQKIINKVMSNSVDSSIYYDHVKSGKSFGDKFYFDKGYVYPKSKIIDKTEAHTPNYLQVKLDKKFYTPTETGLVVEDVDVKFPHGSQGEAVLGQKYKILWKYMNFDHFYFTDNRIIIDFNHVLITTDNKNEALFLFAISNSKITYWLMNKYLKLPDEKDILLGIKPLKRYLRIPSGVDLKNKQELIESTGELLRTNDDRLKKEIDNVLYRMYDLGMEEIEMIEESVK